jgi:NADPH-dependent 2,4-dienoyl-CoA reductase/sulfur reductase-like enzyme/rhodanese-related sulfurtransferase
MKTIIIGGVAGGMSAATRLRRLDENREILVFERGSYVSFANCGLPYHVGGIIPDRSSLLLQSPESLAARFKLIVKVRHEVIAIDPSAKTVTVHDRDADTTQTETYDELILATGATARETISDRSVPTHTLRSIEDMDHITAVLDGIEHPKTVVVGAGFIGLEAVENLLARGAHVTLIQFLGQVLGPLDPEMAAPVQQVLEQAGVDVRCSTTVDDVTAGLVHLSDGSQLEADLVIEATGVRPEVVLAQTAGLTLGPTGGIAVDGRQRTSDSSIWAVGDGVEKIGFLDAQPTLITMAGLANRHGRAAADDIAGVATTEAAPALGTAILGILGLTVGLVGWNEQRLTAAGRAYRAMHTHPSSHAGYYPGAEQMAMKLLVDPEDDTILGAQIVGRDGVDKRIDVISVAMAAGLTASALSRLELAYAPQYGSAKDAVNLLGYVADNLATGATRSLQWHELDEAIAAGAVLVDVRTKAEFDAGTIPGALSLPLDELRARHGELPRGPLVVHCQVGQRGHTASRLLTQLGHDDVRNLDGGWLTWSAGRASRSHHDQFATSPSA